MSNAILQGGASGTGQMTLLAPNTNSNRTVTFPDVDGQAMVNSNMPAFSAYNSTGQSISGGVLTKINCDTEEFDTNNNFSSGRFTPTVAGYYQVNGGSGCPAANYAAAYIYKNGSGYKQGNNGSGGVNSSYVSTLIYLNGTTDYVELYFVDGSSVTLNSGIAQCYFNGCLVRGA